YPTTKAKFEGAVTAAIDFFEHTFTNNVTLNFTFGVFNEPGGPHGSNDPTPVLNPYTYVQIKAALIRNQDSTSSDEKTAYTHLHNDPTKNGHFYLTTAEAKVLDPSAVGSVD